MWTIKLPKEVGLDEDVNFTLFSATFPKPVYNLAKTCLAVLPKPSSVSAILVAPVLTSGYPPGQAKSHKKEQLSTAFQKH
ncbi:hypothetical protein NW752_006249 [Fusarium irregulare]|nr:hypothetical protein NW752_006249 [Fusarium irregulare]